MWVKGGILTVRKAPIKEAHRPQAIPNGILFGVSGLLLLQATGHPKCELRHLDLLRQVPREADPHVAPCQPWDAGQNPIVVL